MRLLEPTWLLLIAPLVLLWWARTPRHGLRWLRFALLSSLLLALASPLIERPGPGGRLVVVVDRSLSMPEGFEARLIAELTDLATEEDAAELAVLGFAADSGLEVAPGSDLPAAFSQRLEQEGSSLARALGAALAMIDPERPGRLVVVSDGRYTGADPQTMHARLRAAGVAVDHLLLERSSAGDLAIVGLEGPRSASPGEAIELHARLVNPRPQQVGWRLLRDGKVLLEGERTAPAGEIALSLADLAPAAGVASYRLEVSGEGEDPVPDNDLARWLLQVGGPKRVLHLGATPRSGLARALTDGGLDLRHLSPGGLDLEALAGAAAVVLENAAVEELGAAAVAPLGSWLEAGGGLYMTGGERAFAAGGWYGSSLEPMLPVSLELRSEQRKLRLAIVVALDRSGSMGAATPDGRTKMQLANLATAEVLELLGPIDEMGVIAVDSAAHVVLPLSPQPLALANRDKILGITAGGGGIFVEEALTAAAEQLLKAASGTRHLILFADAADAEHPGKWRELVTRMGAAEISVSVVALGRRSDRDAELLAEIARTGGGRAFFTERADELPRLFAQDTFVVAGTSWIDEPTPLSGSAELDLALARRVDRVPSIGGYNLTYLRPEARQLIVTADDEAAPLLAWRRIGLGRSAVFTAEADGDWAGPLGASALATELHLATVRRLLGSGSPDELDVRSRLVDGELQVTVELDPERDREPFVSRPELLLVERDRDGAHSSRRLSLEWLDGDRLGARLPLPSGSLALPRVVVDGELVSNLPPALGSVSAELAPPLAGRGRRALAGLSSATGGEALLSLAGTWKRLESSQQGVELRGPLALLAMLLLLLEVAERRSRWLSWSVRKLRGLIPERRASEPPSAAASGHDARPSPPTVERSEAPESEDEDRFSSALERARDRARKRRGDGRDDA